MKLRLNFNCKTKNNSLDICLNHLFGKAQSIQVEFVSKQQNNQKSFGENKSEATET